MNVLKYIQLGFEVFNAVTTLIAMIRTPALLNSNAAWAVILPVLNEVCAVTGIKLNWPLARTISNDAIDTLKAALVKKPVIAMVGVTK